MNKNLNEYYKSKTFIAWWKIDNNSKRKIRISYFTANLYIFNKFYSKKKMEQAGIDPAASCMLSKRSTIWATIPDIIFSKKREFITY